MAQRYLRRYTNFPSLVYLLRNKKITLLNPQSWDDTNDSYFMSIYRRRRKLKTLLALCFTQIPETYHHWRVFAGGSSGVCIRFKRKEFLKAIKKVKGVRAKGVSYQTLADIGAKRPRLSALPFLKRAAFVDEDEFRVVFESKVDVLDTLDITIPLSCIERITLSPWLHSALSKDVKEILKSIKGCDKIDLIRSSLIGNKTWKNYGDSAT